MDHFTWKKIRFWAKKRRKNGFFGVFRHYFKKTLRKLADLIQLSSTLQDSRLLKCRRCANSKREHFSWKKQVLGQKTSKKWVLRGFRHYFRKTLRKLAVSIQLSSNLQGSRLLKCKRCANNKREHFSRKKIEFGPKNFEKMGFAGFSTLLQENAWQTCCIAPIELKVTGQPPIQLQRCASNKIDLFSWKKIRFWAKKFRKNGFFGVFRHYFRKTLDKLAVLLRLSSNLQSSRLFDCRGAQILKQTSLVGKKLGFGPKNFEKTGFSGFSDITSGKRLANLLFCQIELNFTRYPPISL